MRPYGITRLGTQLILPDGREATVVFNGLIGVGCKIGLHNPDPKDFEGTSGGTVVDEPIEDFQWEPDVLLRDPIPQFDDWKCVGDESLCEITRIGFG